MPRGTFHHAAITACIISEAGVAPSVIATTMTLRWIYFYFVCVAYISCCMGRGQRNPYEVLGVSKNASQDDIRRQYRKLCLKYHPDKNVHMKPKDRQKCEELFKTVQHANEQIGDEASRKRYDQMAASPFANRGNNSFGTSSSGMDARTAEAFYRSFMQQNQQRSGRTAFYFNGIDISQLFSGNPSSKPAFWGGPLKSVYIQKVQVPLQDLYSGRPNVEFILRDNLWKRYRAAIRGGIAKTIFFQGFLFAIPLLRISIPVTVIVTAALVHSNMPRPSKILYDVNLQRGWKSGTKLTFKEVEPGFDVIFILEEKKHGRYTRVGNDLETTITIRKKQAREGCVTEIEPLGDYDSPLTFRLRPNQIKRSGQKITLKGKGWPKRQGGGRGDLIVTVNVQSNFARSKRPTAR